jgi:hypothetical protein
MMAMNGLPNHIEHGVDMTGWRKNTEIGGLIMAGDGGYSIGTEEGYKRMVRQRSEALVIALVGKELATKWWTSYNKAFKHTPEAQWELDYRVVYDYLMGHASGSFS